MKQDYFITLAPENAPFFESRVKNFMLADPSTTEAEAASRVINKMVASLRQLQDRIDLLAREDAIDNEGRDRGTCNCGNALDDDASEAMGDCRDCAQELGS